MIAITGMHRTGTSLIANLMSEFGIDFGDPATFLPADEWNARGYYEQRDVLDLNSRIITGFRRTATRPEKWLSQLVYTRMPGRGTLDRRAIKSRPAIERLGAKYAGKAVKDPRFCVTLEYWKAYADVDRVVVCLRSPTETVMSLHRRQRYPLRLGFKFWDYHIERLLAAISGGPCLLIDYNQLAGEEYLEELHDLQAFFGLDLPDDDLVRRHRAVFNPELKHCRATDESRLPPNTLRLWRTLLELRKQTKAAVA